MAEVLLHIGGYNYQVACADGEEEALTNLGNIVNEQIESARLMAGGLSEERQLLFAAILLADKLVTAEGIAPAPVPAAPATPTPPTPDDHIMAQIDVIDALSERIITLAMNLERQNAAIA
ncbi:MAG: cell division protein ZapA [Sphingopyxis sp.]